MLFLEKVFFLLIFISSNSVEWFGCLLRPIFRVKSSSLFSLFFSNSIILFTNLKVFLKMIIFYPKDKKKIDDNEFKLEEVNLLFHLLKITSS